MTPRHTLKKRKETKRKGKKEKNRIEKRNDGEEFENIREMKSDEKNVKYSWEDSYSCRCGQK